MVGSRWRMLDKQISGGLIVMPPSQNAILLEPRYVQLTVYGLFIIPTYR
jgi:hypothetical protein